MASDNTNREDEDLMMNARSEVLLVAVVLAVAAGCSRQSPLVARDTGVESTADLGTDVAGSGSTIVGTGGTVGTGGATFGTGGSIGSGGSMRHGGSTGSGGISVGTGGRVSSGGIVASGGNLATGGTGPGGTGGGGATGCLGISPLGAGVAGGACEGSVRCITEKSATFGYETCNWLVTKGRESVFEAVRACFSADPDFCSQQPASVERCTSSIFPRACAGPGAIVDGRQVDCKSLAAECTAVSEQECHLMTDVLNDKYYQAAFECYFRQTPRPADCRAALRTCTGAPEPGTGGAGGAGGTGGNTSPYDGGAKPACPYLGGTWSVTASCQGAHGDSDSNFVAVMTQTDCTITFTQTDDNTPTQWVSSGSIDSTGTGALKGDFGFTDSSMCDLETSADVFVGRCGSATQACELKAEKVRP